MGLEVDGADRRSSRATAFLKLGILPHFTHEGNKNFPDFPRFFCRFLLLLLTIFVFLSQSSDSGAISSSFGHDFRSRLNELRGQDRIDTFELELCFFALVPNDVIEYGGNEKIDQGAKGALVAFEHSRKLMGVFVVGDVQIGALFPKVVAVDGACRHLIDEPKLLLVFCNLVETAVKKGAKIAHARKHIAEKSVGHFFESVFGRFADDGIFVAEPVVKSSLHQTRSLAQLADGDIFQSVAHEKREGPV